MKRTAFFAMMILAAVCANAQLLWKVSGKDVKSPSYIFGTHHMAPVAVLDSVAGVAEAVASVDELYGELSLAEMTSPETQGVLMGMMTAPADSTLDKVFTPAELAEIDSVFNALTGMPVSITQQLNGFKPAMLSTSMLAILATKCIPGYNPMQQLDMTLLSRGASAGKPVKGLETVEFQGQVLYNSPIAEQAKDLLKSIRTEGGPEKSLLDLNAAYRSGDLAALYALMTDPESGMDDATAEKLLNSRNAAWVDFLIGMIPTTSVLIVVGAGHLPGAKGVIAGLRNVGFEVEPVVE